MSSDLTLDPNGLAALDFLDLTFNQKRVADAFARHVGERYVQHNPTQPDGRGPSQDGVSAMVAAMPEIQFLPKRVIADGQLVAVHANYKAAPDTPGMAAVDIFAFDTAGKIVEHWDVLQAVPETAANSNTMF